MSEEKMRELNAWLAEHVMDAKRCRCVDGVHLMPPTPDCPCEIWGGGARASADTLSVAICLFAKELFFK